MTCEININLATLFISIYGLTTNKLTLRLHRSMNDRIRLITDDR